MSDIDFDELDRAVASVLKGGDKKKIAPTTVSLEPAPESAAEPVIQPLIAAEPLADSPVPDRTSDSTAEPIVVSIPDTPKPTAPEAQSLHPLTLKPVQRGRFLDMVHPSHDMGPRKAVSVSPRLAIAADAQVANQTFVSDVVAPKPDFTTDSEMSTVQPAEASMPVAETPVPTAPDTSEHITDAADFFGGAPPEDTKPDEASVSPFIADAKVEKRPLGAFASDNGRLPIGDELHERLVQVESEDNVIETAESPIPGSIKAPAPVAQYVTPVASAPIEATVTVASVTKTDAKTAKKLAFKAAAIASPNVKMPPHGHGNVIRITVGIVVLLIGFGVGATLYFVVLH